MCKNGARRRGESCNVICNTGVTFCHAYTVTTKNITFRFHATVRTVLFNFYGIPIFVLVQLLISVVGGLLLLYGEVGVPHGA